MTLIEKARSFLSRRREAYRSVFLNPNGDKVLRDLAVFCFANKTTFHDSDRESVLAEGRREVWLRLSAHLNLSPEQLWQLYDGRDE